MTSATAHYLLPINLERFKSPYWRNLIFQLNADCEIKFIKRCPAVIFEAIMSLTLNPGRAMGAIEHSGYCCSGAMTWLQKFYGTLCAFAQHVILSPSGLLIWEPTGPTLLQKNTNIGSLLHSPSHHVKTIYIYNYSLYLSYITANICIF